MKKPIPDEQAAPTVRTEETLRRMWGESISLASKAQKMTREADAAATDAAAAEKVAAAHRQAERTARGIADAMLAEAYDLTDIVNEKRAAAGLPRLEPGEPYDPPPPEVASAVEALANLTGRPDVPVASGGPAETSPMPAANEQDGGEQ